MLSTPIILSALILGFAGSFHCMGMCGPIALSFTMPGPAQRQGAMKPLGIALYFAGKTLTYGLLGLVFGFFGHQLVLAGFQQTLSIIAGIAMMLLVAITLFKPRLFHQNALTDQVNNRLIPVFGKLLQAPGRFTPLWLGLFNGLLPCGLVYLGITAAVATGHPASAFVFMLVFGLGTTPVMFAFLLASRQFGYTFRLAVRRATPVIMTTVGIVLILRGLNLGIPYVSPMLDSLQVLGGAGSKAVGCH